MENKEKEGAESMQEISGKDTEKKGIGREFILVIVLAGLLLTLSFLCWLKKEDDFSESERRVLAKFPEISVKSLVEGDFMEAFESYSLDQFPMRDTFRQIKALSSYYIFGNKANNGIYIEDGYLSKIEYPMNPEMLDYAASHMEKIYDSYLKPYNSKCYFTIVPDKNFFLAKEKGYLAMDYGELFDYMKEKVYFTEYVDITGYLSLEDYYKTDTHWRQEKIVDVAEYLKSVMGNNTLDIDLDEDVNLNSYMEENNNDINRYEVRKFDTPFYGVYCGQSALPVKPDDLYYLNSSILENCKVTSYDTGKPVNSVIYNMDKARGKDAYELFLSGTSALQVIENPKASNRKELLVFRDSFGSSLIPLLVDEYFKITVIDTRYVNSSLLGNMVDFHGQDTLFLYSTLVLNNSMSMH